MNFDWLADPRIWLGLLTLVALEIVLGIDNIVFISILAGKLPVEQRERARKMGIGLALITRVLLLLSLKWVLGLTESLFTLPIPGLQFEKEEDRQKVLGISGRDLILIIGGLFLLGKSTHEIHHKLEGDEEAKTAGPVVSFASVIVQIMLLDIVFSLDSVITAVGMVDQVAVMILAVLIAAGFMLLSARTISEFVDRHPTVKMLALSFLLLIGTTLIGEGFELHIPKGYIYFAMAFSVGVEMLNLRVRHKMEPIHLREPRH